MSEVAKAIIMLAAQYGVPLAFSLVAKITAAVGDPSAEEWETLRKQLEKSFEELVEEGKSAVSGN